MNKVNIKKSLSIIAFSVMAISPLKAEASVIEGVGAYSSVSNFTSCPSYCNGSSFSYDNNGGEGSVEAYTELGQNAYGQAYSSFVSDSYLPLLRVEATAVAGQRTSTSAWSVQNFTNTGTDTKSIDLNVNLHGSVSDNELGYSNNYLNASIAIISGTSLPWTTSFGTLVYELAQPLIEPTYLYIGDGNDVNIFDTISFDIAAGDSFFIVSNMYALGQNGYADAWNTLSMTFDDDSNLQAAIQIVDTAANVPEPETFLLLGLGLAGLLFKRRKI